jgi:hypothetical protein
MDDDNTTRITLRIPSELAERIKTEAEQSTRSLNGEIAARLASTIYGPSVHLPQDILSALSARADAASTSFQTELVRALAAGLDRRAPAVLIVEMTNSTTTEKLGALLDAAREQLPPHTAIRVHHR